MTLELARWHGHTVPVLNGEISRYSLQQYLNDATFRFGGMTYGPGQYGITTTWGQRPAEPIGNNFAGYAEGLLYRDGPLAAAEAYRLRVFGQAPMLFQERSDGRAGDLVDDESLDQLRHPWVGGTTGDLMKRALLYGDLGGNGWVVRVDDELVVLRPDYVTIVLEDRIHEGRKVGFRQVGISYSEYGQHEDAAVFPRGEYAHFVPFMPDPLASYRGMSWMTPIIRDIQSDIGATDHGLAWWSNAATPNLAVSLPKEITPEQFAAFVDKMDEQHKGSANAYKTLYTAGGADVSVVGANMQQIDFSRVVGKNETRIANLSGIHPALLGFSEGMAGSSLNAGNYSAAKRNVVDTTMRDLWANWCGSMQVLFPPPDPTFRLWYDGRDIPFLLDDAKDLAARQQTQASTIASLITAGFKPDSAVSAVTADDLAHLEHTGLTSVQLLPPGAQDTDADGSVDDFADPEGEQEYTAALEEFRSRPRDEDEIQRRRYGTGAGERVGVGFQGGGQFRKLSDRLVALFADHDGDGDPLEGWTQPQLKQAAKQLGVDVPPRTSAARLKLALLKHVRGDASDKPDAPEKPAKKAVPRTRAPRIGGRHLSADERERVASVVDEALAAGDGVPFFDEGEGRLSVREQLGVLRDGLRDHDEPFDVDAIGFITGSLSTRFGIGSRHRVQRHDAELVEHLRTWLPQISGAVSVEAPRKSAKKAVPRKAVPRSTADHVAAIRRLTTTEEVGAYLDSHAMSVPDMKALARELGGSVDQRGTTKARIRDNIVIGTVGFRETAALFGRMHEPDGAQPDLEPKARDRQAVPTAHAVRQELVAMPADQRRDYLAGLGLTKPQAASLARDLGARPSRDTADGSLDNIVKHFEGAVPDSGDEPEFRMPESRPYNLAEEPEDLKLLRDAERGSVQMVSTQTGRGRQRNGRLDMHRRRGWLKKIRGLSAYEITPAGRDALASASAPDLEPKARDRQARVVALGAVGTALGEVEEIVDNGSGPEVLESRIRSRAALSNLPPAVVDDLLAAVAAGDVAAAVDRIAQQHGLTRVGGPAGSTERFTRGVHKPIGSPPRQGAPVAVVRPGYSAVVDGKPTPVSPRLVEEISEAEFGQAQARDRQAQTDAARKLTSAASDLDELLANDASDRALLHKLDAAGRRDGTTEELKPVRDALAGDPALAREVEVENRIRASYRAVHARTGGDWIGLADIRDELGEDLPRGEIDAALRRIEQQDGANIVPESNQKMLTQADRDSSVRIGDQDKHAIHLDDPSDRSVGDRDAARREMASLLAAKGITQDATTGDIATFDRTRHDPVGNSRLRDGQPVTVVRPGYTVGDTRLSKAVVVEADAPDTPPVDVPDPETTRDALDLKTVPQLKAMLKARGLPVSGRKRDLVDRLVGDLHPKEASARHIADSAVLSNPDNLGSPVPSRLTPQETAARDRAADQRVQDTIDIIDWDAMTPTGLRERERAEESRPGKKVALSDVPAGYEVRETGKDAGGDVTFDVYANGEKVGTVRRYTKTVVDSDSRGLGVGGRRRQEFEFTPAAEGGRASTFQNWSDLLFAQAQLHPGDSPTAPRTGGRAAGKASAASEVWHDYSPFLEKAGVADSELSEHHRATLQEIADRLNDGTPAAVLARDLRSTGDPLLARIAKGVEHPDLMRRTAEPAADVQRAVDYDEPEDDDPGQPDDDMRARAQACLDDCDEDADEPDAGEYEVHRAAGMDTNPGGERLHYWWTKGPGLRRWASSPHPWTALFRQLARHVGAARAKRMASAWFHEVFGFAAGSDLNRVTHGRPPRGEVVGPG